LGKWTEIAKTLPRREEEPGRFRERVNELKDAARAKTLDELAADYRQVRKEKEDLEVVESGINARQMALEALLSETWVSEARDTPFYFTDGSRIEVSDQISVRAADQEAVTAWAKANNYERFLTMNAKRLEGLTKAALESGDAIPDGVVVTAYSQVKLASK
jgi:uncharacterized phage protein gp47/JayE